jgi:RimJ/RimL family protein N-acetyltransferase
VSLELLPLADEDFPFLLGETSHSTLNLTLPPGGAEKPELLPFIRRMVANLRACGLFYAWMMVDSGEIVGLCNVLRPPQDGVAQIGYGVSAARRRRGHATAAVAAMVARAAANPALRELAANTAPDNFASHRVLVKNAFSISEKFNDPQDGPLLRWRLALR